MYTYRGYVAGKSKPSFATKKTNSGATRTRLGNRKVWCASALSSRATTSIIRIIGATIRCMKSSLVTRASTSALKIWFGSVCRAGVCVVYEKESHSLYRAGACVYVKESNNSRFQDLVWFRVLCRGGVVGRGRERQKSKEIGRDIGRTWFGSEREIGRTWFGSVPHINTHMNT